MLMYITKNYPTVAGRTDLDIPADTTAVLLSGPIETRIAAIEDLRIIAEKYNLTIMTATQKPRQAPGVVMEEILDDLEAERGLGP